MPALPTYPPHRPARQPRRGDSTLPRSASLPRVRVGLLCAAPTMTAMLGMPAICRIIVVSLFNTTGYYEGAEHTVYLFAFTAVYAQTQRAIHTGSLTITWTMASVFSLIH